MMHNQPTNYYMKEWNNEFVLIPYINSALELLHCLFTLLDIATLDIFNRMDHISHTHVLECIK